MANIEQVRPPIKIRRNLVTETFDIDVCERTINSNSDLMNILCERILELEEQLKDAALERRSRD